MTGNQKHSWQSVRNEIQGWVLSGRYEPGDKLPRDEDIATTLGCARSTVVRAMQDLSQEGIVERRRKGGTFIRRHRSNRAIVEIPVHRIEIERQDKRYGYKLLSQNVAKAPENILERFQKTDPISCLNIRALHYSDDKPYIYEDRWVSLEIANEIIDADLAKISANEWLIENCPYDDIAISCSAETSDKIICNALHTDLGDAHFCLQRTTWNRKMPITTVTSWYHKGFKLQLQ